MHIAKIPSEKLKHKFEIKVTAAEVQGKFDSQLQKMGSKVRIPGFRPGKAPRAILEQRYGTDTWAEVENVVLREALAQIYKDHKFRNALEPKVDIISFEQGKDFECAITFEVFPDIDIKTFKDISVDVLNVTVSDEDVEQRLNKMCEEHVRYQAPTDPRAAQKGDLVSVRWSGTLEDGKGIELPETYQILLGPEREDSPFAPIVKNLYGKKAGDCFEGKIQFSMEEKVADLKGKKAEIKVEVQDVQEPVTFELDDTFAKEFELEKLDDLRQSVRQAVEFEGRKVARLYTKRKLLDALDAQYDFDLPPTMVEREFQAIWEQLQRELADADGELGESGETKPEEELKSEYEAIARRRVKLGLLISHLGEVHKIKLSDEEVRMAIFQEALRYPSEMEDVIKYYTHNKEALQNLLAPFLEDKVVDFILGQSDVTERNIDFPTLKQVVRGVIPTPYDEEEELEEDELEEDKESQQQPPKAAPSRKAKPKANKSTTVEAKGKGV